MKKIFTILIIFFLYITSIIKTYATSSYILPYPSVMPGGIEYKIHLVWEKLMQFWYFGNFGQFEYNLKQSDKYLVEVKTLFEYNQYLLAYNALQKSDSYFQHTLPFLNYAKAQGKDIYDKRKILSQAAEKHIEVLTLLKKNTPSSFLWKPEKAPTLQLDLASEIEKSINIRKKYL